MFCLVCLSPSIRRSLRHGSSTVFSFKFWNRLSLLIYLVKLNENAFRTLMILLAGCRLDSLLQVPPWHTVYLSKATGARRNPTKTNGASYRQVAVIEPTLSNLID
ncbi:hypothetical protein HOLleu_23759 [Holothuria leucospilota]|uniref:Uncharacterized protein n=1 Tax=Holothuria leucospilota TaxID=206669 RepID=A0A9Q1BVP4_HOLLE|nr:hypothetical protein HOLleu_23759 [Holothuria leucospilota]